MKTKARQGQGQLITPQTRELSRGELPSSPLNSPLGDILSRLQEPRMIILLQRVFRLGDEGRRPLDALLAVCNLLSEFAKPHHLEKRQGDG